MFEDESPQTPYFKLLPASGTCQRELRLNQAGIPIVCSFPAMGRLPDGPALCKKHLEEQMDVLEVRYKARQLTPG